MQLRHREGQQELINKIEKELKEVPIASDKLYSFFENISETPS